MTMYSDALKFLLSDLLPNTTTQYQYGGRGEGEGKGRTRFAPGVYVAAGRRANNLTSASVGDL